MLASKASKSCRAIRRQAFVFLKGLSKLEDRIRGTSKKMSKKLYLAIFAFTFIAAETAQAGFDLSQQKAVQVDQVNTAIKAYGAGWVAKDNWVSQLTTAQVKRMLGLRTPPDVNLMFKAGKSKISKNTSTTAVFDWRSVNGVNWVTPVHNQGYCGSCVAFATAGTLETQMNISSKFPDWMPAVSTQALFACGGGSCDMGWDPDEATDFLSSQGVPDYACLPYTSGATGNDVQCSAACADIASRSIKTVPSTSKIHALGSVDSVKAALAHGPLETTLTVYADFLSYSSGVYKHVTGAALGGHAVSIIGYDDNQQAWIVRNSWGPDWGNAGFILVSYNDTSGVAQDVWSFDIPTEAGYISFQTPTSEQVLTGTANLQIASTVDASSTLNYTILNSAGKAVVQNSLHGMPQSISLDTTKLADGQYEIFASAVTPANATVNSLHVQFYVLNSQPTGSLSFSPQGFDITKPLTDMVVFTVTAPSSPVPYGELILHMQQNGKDVLIKTIDTVMSDMSFDWRTQTVPNGQYDIFMTATISAGEYSLTSESSHATVTVTN